MKVSDEQLKQLVNARSSTRSQNLEFQMDKVGVNCHPRKLKNALVTRTNNARKYRKAKVKKIKPKNKHERVEYGHRHKGKTISEFWRFIHFTDEAHIDPTKVFNETIL